MPTLAPCKIRLSHAPVSRVVTVNGADVPLPVDYLTLLGCEPLEGLDYCFKFLSVDDNHEWEGQVVEFMRYDQSWVNSAVISLPTDRARKLLPIAVDAGGNYLYLDLTTSPMRVVDVSYASGAISKVANSFGEFIDILYRVEE